MEKIENKILEGKVLVVDDEESIRDIVRMYLEYRGLTVKTASDGVEALDIIEDENFDVVLSDIMMPGMDGLTLAGKVKEKQPDTVMILMTGYASVNTAVEAIQRGVFDYILKPFQNMQIISQSLERGIERKRLIQERDTLIDDLRRTNDELTYHRGLLEEQVLEIDSELSRRVKRLATLYDIGRSTTYITNLDDLLQKVMRSVSSAMNDAIGILWLANSDRKIMKKVVTIGLHNENIVPENLLVHEGLVGETIRSGRPRAIKDTGNLNDPVFKKICDAEKSNSLIMVSLRYEHETLGVVTVLFRDNYFIKDDDVSLLVAIADQASVSIKNAELYAAQQKMFCETIEALATAIDSRDHYTGGHSDMVTRYSLMIAKRLGFDENRLELLRVAGLLHDVGKIGISDMILHKPGKLTDEEMAIIREHPAMGRVILESIDALKPVAKIIYHHHERYDGKGYPDGLSKEDIPLESRIIQVADIFHALTSDRRYRKAMPLEKAVSVILNGFGTVSDPEIGGIFLKIIGEGTPDLMIGVRIKRKAPINQQSQTS